MKTPEVSLRSMIKLGIRKLMLTFEGKKRAHFIHIGKTGGTAVKYALKPYLETCAYKIYLHGHNFRLVDIPRGEYFFFFVRDPVERFVSGFYSRQRQGMPRHKSPWSTQEKEAFERFSTANDLAISLKSENKERREMARSAMGVIQHVRSSYWHWFQDQEYFLSRVEDLLFMGFQERLDEDFEILKSRLNLPLEIKLPKDSVESHKNPSSKEITLSAGAIENLKEWYNEDYLFIDLCKSLNIENSIDSIKTNLREGGSM